MKRAKATLAGIAALIGLGVGGGAGAVVTVSTSDSFRLQAGGRMIEARMSGDELIGPDIQVERFGSELRGRAFQVPIRIGWQPGSVSGQVGSAPVRLRVEQVEDGVDARGLFAGGLGDLHLRSTSIRGRIGSCDYDLALAGGYYSGFRRCGLGGVTTPTTLVLPEQLAALDDAGRVAYLGLILAR